MWKYVVHSTFLLKKNYHKNLASKKLVHYLGNDIVQQVNFL